MKTTPLTLLLALLALLLLPTAALAQSAEDFTDLGNNLYGEGKYREAVSAYTKAIQTRPRGALRAYRNMARAHNKLKSWAPSVQYYEWYLELAPDAKDARKIKAELRQVKRRLKDPPDTILSESQQTALGQLQARLESGPFLARDGSGCVSLYEVLLRTGFATPQLAPLKEALGRGLAEEALSSVRPAEDQVVPALDREGWALVRERITRAEELLGQVEPATLAVTDLSHGWDQYTMANYDRAQQHFRVALTDNPRLLAAHWGLAMSTYLTDSGAYAATLAALDGVETAFEAQRRDPAPFVPMMRAIALQSAGEHDRAAQILRSLPQD